MSDTPDTAANAAAPHTLGGYFYSGATAALAPQTHERLRLAEAYATVFDSPAGRIVWNDLVRMTGALDSPFVAGEGVNDTHVRLGRHEVGLHLLNRRRWAQAQFGRFDEPVEFSQIAAQERFAEGADPSEGGA